MNLIESIKLYLLGVSKCANENYKTKCLIVSNLLFLISANFFFCKRQCISKISILVLLFLFFFLNFNTNATAQTYSLTINGLPNQHKMAYKKIFSDSLKVIKQVDSVVQEIKLSGYFNTAIKDFNWNKKKLMVYLLIGKPYKLYQISNGNINPEALSFHNSSNNQTWNVAEIKSLYNQILSWYENNGYPFAQVWLDSFSFNKENVSAKIFCKPNTKFFIDSVSIIGTARLSNKYIYASLDIKPHDIYQENKIALIDKRLRSLNIISLQKSSEVIFAEDKASINLYINQKNANQFDGIIGFLPSADGKKIQLTGDFKLKLQNALKRGELIGLTYSGLPDQSQQLITQINYPYLFLSKIGLDVDFQLFKKDTTFLNLNTKLGFSYAFTPERSIHLFVENYKGNLISSNKDNVTTGLPPFVNIASTCYGIGGTIDKVDNSILPKKGYRLNFTASVGQRKLIKDKSFNPADFPQINGNTTQYKLNADLNYYKKITPKLGLYLRNQSAFISGKNVFENEAYRIGGFKILRGFDEQSILVSSYTVQTLEARYFIERNSFLFGFYDQGWIKQSFVTGQRNDIPASFGGGIDFETKLGIMSLSYALGKQQNNPINLQKGKIHFGLVSYF
jgi:outer membrane protein assembly factor BamA